MSYLQAIVIALVQGVTELFPVSSLGHSVLVPAWIGGTWASRRGSARVGGGPGPRGGAGRGAELPPSPMGARGACGGGPQGPGRLAVGRAPPPAPRGPVTPPP